MLRLTRTRAERVRFFSLFHYIHSFDDDRVHIVYAYRRRRMRSPPAPPRTGVQHLSSTTIVARARKNHTYSIPTINHRRRRRRQEKLQREYFYYYYREKVLRHMQGCATRLYTFNMHTRVHGRIFRRLLREPLRRIRDFYISTTQARARARGTSAPCKISHIVRIAAAILCVYLKCVNSTTLKSFTFQS